MTGNVQIILQDHENALLVPAAALGKDPDGQYTATVVKADNSREDRKVTVGITDGDNTEILGGLSNGEKVVVQNEVQSRWSGDQTGQSAGATTRKNGS
jgi:multidrug efflux pump subunit AcrA (membrane-fusion protein)